MCVLIKGFPPPPKSADVNAEGDKVEFYGTYKTLINYFVAFKQIQTQQHHTNIIYAANNPNNPTKKGGIQKKHLCKLMIFKKEFF